MAWLKDFVPLCLKNGDSSMTRNLTERVQSVFRIKSHPVDPFIRNPSAKLGHMVAQLVEALRYKLEGCRFNSLWCHWNFSLSQSFQLKYGPGVKSASNRNE
jgi:hypothetical protein